MDTQASLPPRTRLLIHLVTQGMDQKDFAAQIGISASTLSRIVNDLQPPSLETATAIERQVGIPATSWVAA